MSAAVADLICSVVLEQFVIYDRDDRESTKEGSPVHRRLYRSRRGRILGGVISGLGEFSDTDPVLLRLIAVVLTFLTGGWLILAYIAAWLIVPEEPTGEAGSAKSLNESSVELGERLRQSAQEMVDAGARLARDVAAAIRSSMGQSTKPLADSGAETGAADSGPAGTRSKGSDEAVESNGARVIGILLVIVGAIALFNKFVYSVFRANVFVPVALIVLGVALILSGRRK